MTLPQPADIASVKALIQRETRALRAEVTARGAPSAPPAPAVRAPEDTAVCGCGLGLGPAHDCAGAGGDHDPWACLCATLPAVPVSAALLAPVRDAEGRVTDFVIRAGNHVRCADWLPSPDEQVGQRLGEARPGLAAGGLLDALRGVLETGRVVKGLVVDCTETWDGRLRRVQLVHYAASCGDQVLTTWHTARGQTELLTIDAQHLASMGWARWDLLSGGVAWSEGMHRIFRAEPELPWTLPELCDALVPADAGPFGEFLVSVLAGEEPAWTRVRFTVHGEVRTVDLLGRPVTGTDGRSWAVQMVAHDLTPQIRGRRRLADKQSEADRLRRQAAAEQRVASVLREALLPTYSEGLAGLGITAAAAYLPAEPEAAVGGDWFKCRPLADDRALIAMGDATGHGLDAVARMAQQRYAVAGLAQTGADAGAVTTWLNELVGGEAGAPSSGTVAIAFVGRDRVLHWASAGHPAPLVLRDGTPFPLPTDHRGPMLGALPGHPYATAEFPMLPGDVLLLYTDGVVERRGQDIEDGIATLARSLAACRELTPRGIVDRLAEEYVRGTHDDDACLLAVRFD